jgi:arabinan endo-1,5-alpha-L-arabinosidase
LVGLLVGALVWTAGPAVAKPEPPRPILNENFPDPAVVATGSGLVGFATGELTPAAWATSERGRWQRNGPALTRLPDWSSEGGVWAVDVVRAGGQWVMYYAAPVDGIVEYGRCIGVAVAARPRDRFRPVGGRPLVCPEYADTPRAEDTMEPVDVSLPRAGVIDPSHFTDLDGMPYLLYKTDRIPSSIRIVPLSDDGLHVRKGLISQELFRVDGVFENPHIIRRPRDFVMLVSRGDWTKCEYRTDWIRSPSLVDWSVVQSGILLEKRTSGLCGPGGADLVEIPGKKQPRLFFHAWTCHRRPEPCRGPKETKWDHHWKRYQGVRALYAARVGWRQGRPRIAGWVSGR